MLYLPKGIKAKPEELHQLIAHEAVHALISDLDDAPGSEGDWYTEGTADYFAVLIPHEAGLVSLDETLIAFNHEAALYYTNSLRTITNQQLTQLMWSGRNAWTVPYARGALYFADLDAKLRQHKVGLTVVDLVNETSARIRAGAPATNATWLNVLQTMVGDWAVNDWRGMLSGNLILPIQGSFGDIYKGIPTPVAFFDLGFDSPKAILAGNRIGEVHSDSAASRAGLRNGDVVAKSLDLNPTYRSFRDPITLQVSRGNARKAITFEPRDGAYPGMSWIMNRQTIPEETMKPKSN